MVKRKPKPRKPGSKRWRVDLCDVLVSLRTGGIALGAQVFHALTTAATPENIGAAAGKDDSLLMAFVAFALAGIHFAVRVAKDYSKGRGN
jgi:hypothetical protein